MNLMRKFHPIIIVSHVEWQHLREGKDYPFAAVITQDYKNDPSDPDGIKYVHYGEWPEAIHYTGNLILNHYDETKEYTNHRYVYKNGDNGISPNLISTETDTFFSTLNDEMDVKGSSLSWVPILGRLVR